MRHKLPHEAGADAQAVELETEVTRIGSAGGHDASRRARLNGSGEGIVGNHAGIGQDAEVRDGGHALQLVVPLETEVQLSDEQVLRVDAKAESIDPAEAALLPTVCAIAPALVLPHSSDVRQPHT